jgi:hypothetical protein
MDADGEMPGVPGLADGELAGGDAEVDMQEVKGMMVEWFKDYDNGEYMERINKLKDTPGNLRLLVSWSAILEYDCICYCIFEVQRQLHCTVCSSLLAFAVSSLSELLVVQAMLLRDPQLSSAAAHMLMKMVNCHFLAKCACCVTHWLMHLGGYQHSSIALLMS